MFQSKSHSFAFVLNYVDSKFVAALQVYSTLLFQD